MPGRFAIISTPEILRDFFAYVEEPDFPPRYNIAPTQPIPVVTAAAHSQGQRRHFTLMRWGFLPAFVKDPKAFALIINARGETLTEKASFRAAVKRRRCLIIADGFYEWLRGPGRAAAARSFLIRRPDRGPMGFAGLYETWSDPNGGEIDTACIITTPPNQTIAAIHDRMPAIIDPRDFHFWLDNDSVEASAATALLRPAPDDSLELVEVGMEVNRVGNDDAEIQRPVSPPLKPPGKAQGELF
ncbi:SOS response-associated peptidase [Methylocapsa sp. S129]|uniref:SOS response-associated peptidase n=1 Tax=Methylocapsa sp. S129 TaxID=1641869 RepID=UPI00131E19ED|nr:SOS response-associated peptidase [Methylocapsa sp. S129]